MTRSGYIEHVIFLVTDVNVSDDGILTLRVCGTEPL